MDKVSQHTVIPAENDRFVTMEGRMTENHQAILRMTNSGDSTFEMKAVFQP